MLCVNIIAVLLLVNSFHAVEPWGFPAEGDEVLKPQLWSALNGTAVRPQSVRPPVSSGSNYKPRFNTGNRTVAGLPPGVKEETTERTVEQSSREVTETQHATCKISTEELVATAQATVTRVLKGLCNTKVMEDRFHNLETQLAEQLNVIKTMLLNIEDRITEQDQSSRRGQRRIMATLLRHCQSLAPVFPPSNSGKPSLTTFEHEEDSGRGWTDEESSNEISESPRNQEVERYNSTIHAEPIPGQTYSSQRSRAFTYYWRIHGMEYKLTGWNHRRSLRSPSFYISPAGYRMYIRIYPRQNEENVYVHVGVTRGEYDDNLPWPFKLKHRINILDQVSSEVGAQEDISSRVWDPTALCSEFNWQKPTTGDNYECVGLGFPHNVIRSRHYIQHDTIIIKLTVYLD